MYHKVARVKPQSLTKGHYVAPGLFANQLRLLKLLGYQSDRLDRVFEHDCPNTRPVVITFDDGYQDYYENALPRLEAMSFSGTVFLVANHVGGSNRWDVEKGDVEEPLMSLDQILDAQKRGTEFGSHTLDHADLPSMGAGEAFRQIHDSRHKLSELLGTDVNTFCYPYGRKSPEVMHVVEKCGYRVACSTEKGLNTRGTNRYALRRINVRSDTWTAVLLFKLLRSRAKP